MKRKFKYGIPIICAINILLICVFIFLPRIGFSSPENLIRYNPSLIFRKVYGTIESNDTTIVFYRGSSANESDIIYEKNGRYFLYRNKSSILFEHTYGGMVIVRSVGDKYTIYIHDLAEIVNIKDVSDNLGTKFEYEVIDYGQHYCRKWFASLDEIPDDYYIRVNDEIFYVKTE